MSDDNFITTSNNPPLHILQNGKIEIKILVKITCVNGESTLRMFVISLSVYIYHKNAWIALIVRDQYKAHQGAIQSNEFNHNSFHFNIY